MNIQKGTPCIYKGRPAEVTMIRPDGSVDLAFKDKYMCYPVQGSWHDIRKLHDYAVACSEDVTTYIHHSFEANCVPTQELDLNMENTVAKAITESEVLAYTDYRSASWYQKLFFIVSLVKHQTFLYIFERVAPDNDWIKVCS
jgi:hypothetical protein